jgi:hypothetical protein
MEPYVQAAITYPLFRTNIPPQNTNGLTRRFGSMGGERDRLEWDKIRGEEIDSSPSSHVLFLIFIECMEKEL